MAMVRTGKVQRSIHLGETNVAYPADIRAFMRQAKPGTIYAEFDVPKASIFPKGSGWATIRPTAMEIKLLTRKELPIPEMTPVRNIVPLATRIRLPGQP